MRCPVCNHAETRVVDTRVSGDGVSIRRRRECDHCEYRFSTLEEVELLDITVVKRDGRREMYHREKLERGIRRSLEKRSFTEADFRTLMHTIEQKIHKLKNAEIRSSELGEIVMDALKGFDKVAYIRFASVYRAFEDVKTFQTELSRLQRPPARKKRKAKRR